LTSFGVEDFDQSWILKFFNEEVLKEFATPKNKKQKLVFLKKLFPKSLELLTLDLGSV
jgi:hypothetical protein